MESMKFAAIICLVLYYVFVIWMAVREKATKSEEDYFLASRSLSPWLLAISYSASWFGGASLLITADKAFASGISSYLIMGGPTVISGLLFLFLARRIRILAPISQPMMTEERYSVTARTIQAIIVIWYMTTWAASQMIASASFVSGFLQISYPMALFLIVGVVWFYCMFGGFKSVVRTDMGQFIWIIAAIIIIFFAVFLNFEGWDTVTANTSSRKIEGFYHILTNFKYSFFYIFSFTFAWMLTADVWQRFSAAKDPAAAQKASWGALVINVPLFSIVTLIGMMAAGVFANKPEEQITVAIINQLTHPVFGAIAFAGIIAALMSSMDTCINTGTLIATEDIYHRFVNPNASQKEIVNAGRIIATVITALAIFISLSIKDMLWVLWMASDILASGLTIPVIAGMFWKRGTTKGAIASMVVGSCFVLWNYLIDLGLGLPHITPAWPGTGWPFSIFWGVLLGGLVYVIVSLATQSEEETAKAEAFLARAKQGNSGTGSREAAAPSI
ncbi:MAG: sodium:solute symporter family protein [Desulfobacterales bacterium]|nr:sodium:solute symporter family protein [Desulfobacterales bacterium]